jgi:hypothetical protein
LGGAPDRLTVGCVLAGVVAGWGAGGGGTRWLDEVVAGGATGWPAVVEGAAEVVLGVAVLTIGGGALDAVWIAGVEAAAGAGGLLDDSLLLTVGVALAATGVGACLLADVVAAITTTATVTIPVAIDRPRRLHGDVVHTSSNPIGKNTINAMTTTTGWCRRASGLRGGGTGGGGGALHGGVVHGGGGGG